ncbi:MAG: hypothetical protein KC583_21940 [Myxococcales bacterium]|nr:hypothetical protein [Myxococcales bacterium]
MATQELQEVKVGTIRPLDSTPTLVKGQARDYVKITGNTTLTAAQSGSVVGLAVAAGATVTLPALSNYSKCLEFEFVVVTNCTSNSYIINTASSSDKFIGGFNELETDTGDDGPSDTGTAVTITLGNATDTVGDSFRLLSIDGRKWLVRGQTALDGGAAFS